MYWADNSPNETTFRIRRSTRRPDGTFGPFQPVGTVWRNGTSFTDEGVTPDATYRYNVQACDVDVCSAFSAPSPPITLAIPTLSSGVPVPNLASDLGVRKYFAIAVANRFGGSWP